jgi:Tfp pilus assembly protein PilF
MVSHKHFSHLLVMFLCLFLVACSSPEEKKERHYLKALEYIKQEDPKAAMIELRNAIQIDAKYADARYQLGLLYLEENEPQKAFSELIRAADLDHDNLDANLKAAELYLITRK